MQTAADPAPARPRSSSPRLRELARRIQGQPWNRPGSDKTWVLRALWEQQRFQVEVSKAERVGAG